MCDFSGSTTGNYKGVTRQVSQGKAGLLTPDLEHSQDTAVSGSCSQTLRPPIWSCSCIYMCIPTQAPSLLGTSAENALMGTRRATLKTLFPTLTQYSVLFDSQPLSLTLLPTAGSYKTAGAFSVWFPQQEDDPQICADSLDPRSVCYFMRGNGTLESALPLVVASCLHYYNEFFD